MPTIITQVEDNERNKVVLQVKGELLLEDAVLLEKIALGLREDTKINLSIDFSDLDLLDSESASVIKRLEEEHGFEIEGLQFFLQKIVDEAEKHQTDS